MWDKEEPSQGENSAFRPFLVPSLVLITPQETAEDLEVAMLYLQTPSQGVSGPLASSLTTLEVLKLHLNK